MHVARSSTRHRRPLPPRPSRHAAPGLRSCLAPLAHPARRAGDRASAFAALGAFATLVVLGIVLVFVANVVRPG